MVLRKKQFLYLSGYMKNLLSNIFTFKQVINTRRLQCCFFILVAASFLIQPSLVSATNTIDEGAIADEVDEELLAELRKKMNSITESVSEKRLNADHVPGIISVYYGKDLAKRGIRTVGEAMTLIPGVNFSLNEGGKWQTIVRGLPEIFATGHIKILLNGNSLITVTGMELLPNIPIDLVDRIEMIRGPASTIYGEFAYSGVLNVVTRSGDNTVFTGTGSYDSYSAGVNLFKASPKKDLSIDLNLSLQSTKRGYLDLGGSNSLENIANDSPPLDAELNEPLFNEDAVSFILRSKNSEKRKDLISAITDIRYKSLGINSYYIENSQGSFYSTHQEGIFLTQNFSLSESFSANFKAGWQQQVSDENYAQFYVNSPEVVNPVYEISYDAEKYQGGLDLFWENTDNKLTLGLNYSFSKPITLWRDTNDGEQSVKLDDREVVSILCQDSYSLSEKCTLTFGLRYDYYDDFDSVFSPKIAAVYRLNEKRSSVTQHIIKTQYARAFKPPAFFDLVDPGAEVLFVSENNRLETNDTFELSYIFKGYSSIVRLTGFYSILSVRADTNTSNEEKLLYGGEFELEKDLLPDVLKLDTNCSYAYAKDSKTDKELPDSVNWLANAGLKWTPFSALTLSMHYSFAGKRNNEAQSSNSDPVHSSDITAFFKPKKSGLSLHLGVKNLFNEDVRYPSHLDQDHIPGNIFISYPEDSQRPERWWWMKVAYDF